MAWYSPHYIYFSPTYIHLLIIYAFCRVDDLSWGTKGAGDHKSGPDSDDAVKEDGKMMKFRFVITWLASNFFMAASLNILMKTNAYLK